MTWKEIANIKIRKWRWQREKRATSDDDAICKNWTEWVTEQTNNEQKIVWWKRTWIKSEMIKIAPMQENT